MEVDVGGKEDGEEGRSMSMSMLKVWVGLRA